MVAVYFLTTGINGLAQVGVSTFVQQLFYGGALVIAVLLSSLVGRPSLRPGRGRRQATATTTGGGQAAQPVSVAPSNGGDAP
jgi:hypothetical protein